MDENQSYTGEKQVLSERLIISFARNSCQHFLLYLFFKSKNHLCHIFRNF
jgi:hypothetical protein